MRLKAVVENVVIFSRIAQAIEKQSKHCVMKFSPTTLQIICSGESSGEGGVQVWSQIRIETLFRDFQIQSNSQNEITCELQTEPLNMALKSAVSSATDVTLKLAKRNDVAVFCFEMRAQSRQGKRMDVTHDVRVRILRQSEVAAIKEPLCPEPDIHIILPPLVKLRTVAERLARLSSEIAILANVDGTLKMSIETDNASVATQWSNCRLPQMNDTVVPDDGTPKDDHFAILPSRSLLRFLSSHVVSNDKTIASICSRFCLIMYVYIGEFEDNGGVLTFYIPSRLHPDDD